MLILFCCSKPTKAAKAKDGLIGRSSATLAYERVKKWTKKVDLFEKKMVIVPICEELVKHSIDHFLICACL